MEKVRVTLPLTRGQSEMLAAAVDISFRSDYFPLELNLGLEYNPQQASDEAAVGMGINRIVVTDGAVSLAKRHWED